MKVNKILGIAINEYDDDELNKIENCENDVKKIISTLTDKYEFEDVEFIYQKNDTTRKALFNKLSSYFINTLDDENVLLIYAGHGEYNPLIQTAYWQPSDSDPKDPSTWINVSEILAFIKVAKAFHISVISDSCFSGAIFEPAKRGGGSEAFSSKKSRQGLTSGGIEKVSDGMKGELSPFAETLIKLLEENTSDEMPFSFLANNLLMNFHPQRKQTPMFGSLNNSGHDGGSFVFKLKSEKKVADKLDDLNAFLAQRLKNLFIPLSREDIDVIELIQPIAEQKNTAVKKQNYEEAAHLRDKEKNLENKIFERSSIYIDKNFGKVELKEENFQTIEQLNRDIDEHKKLLIENAEKAKVQFAKMEEAIIQTKGKITPEDKENIDLMIDILYGGSYIGDPSIELFQNNKEKFVDEYQISVLKIYEHMLSLIANSDNEFLNKKLLELKQILIKIYKYEIVLVNRGYFKNVDEIIDQKKIDIELLNWIKE